MYDNKISSLVNALRTLKLIFLEQQELTAQVFNSLLNTYQDDVAEQEKRFGKYTIDILNLMGHTLNTEDFVNYAEEVKKNLENMVKKRNTELAQVKTNSFENELLSKGIYEKWTEFDYILDEMDEDKK